MNQLLTIKHTASILGVSEQQAYALVRASILPVVKVGRQYRVDPTTLQEWIKSGGQAYPGGWKKTIN